MGSDGRARTRIESKVRLRLIAALKNGKVQHEMLEGQVNSCDLLQSGAVSAREVIEFLKPSRGLKYEEVPHPFLSDVKTMIFKTNAACGGLPVSWYVKCYCLFKNREEVWFIGVHSASKRKVP
ncbi:MAG: hypothetical protein JWQ35_1086 [Bacteriovoracaceae bacterium]|nr:hypothetical protein [Bacteriovoracaceae bacterium]